jgi:hypothetical protein
LDIIGGAKQDRTADLYNAIVALSQLSYDPKNKGGRTNQSLIVSHFFRKIKKIDDLISQFIRIKNLEYCKILCI